MHIVALLVSLNLILPGPAPYKADPIPKIVKTKSCVAVSGFGGIYVYYPEADLSEFIIQFAVRDVSAKFVAELDKNDKPVKLMVLGKRGTMPARKALFEKPDAKSKEFFDYTEKLVRIFVREYNVRARLEKYKLRKNPAPPTPASNQVNPAK